ncbi:MAG: DUF1214 domain-containing protein [Steroidobacteraceae bacterium]
MATSSSSVLQSAWERYYRTLDEMRKLIEATPRFKDNAQNQAKAYHCLIEAQAITYNFVMAPRLMHPRIHTNTSWQTDMYTLGQNGPDFHYGAMFLDGRQTYRLSGHYGDVILFLMQVQNGMPGQKGVSLIGDYNLSTFARGPRNEFEIILSATEQPGNWVKLSPDSRYQFLLTRRVIKDPHDDPGVFRLERISEVPKNYYDDDEFDPVVVAQRLDLATDFVRYMCQGWMIGLYDMYLSNAGGQRNKMTLLAGTTTSQVAASVSNYAMAIFDLKPDEAAIVELPQSPDGLYWSFQLGDAWSRSLDFVNCQTSLNMHQIAIDPDGGVRVILSHRDPGYHNWLDVTGREEGMIVLRNFVAKSAPVPSMRKVKLADLERELPGNMRRVTPAERAQALEHRRTGYLKRYGE